MDKTSSAAEYELPPPASFKRSEPFAPDHSSSVVWSAVLILFVAAAIGIALWWSSGLSQVPSGRVIVIDVPPATVPATVKVTVVESSEVQDDAQVIPGSLVIATSPPQSESDEREVKVRKQSLSPSSLSRQ